MRSITIWVAIIIALAGVSRAHAELEFHADFAQNGVYDKSWPMIAGEVVSVDIYVSNVPTPGLIAMGFKLVYDPGKLSVIQAVVDEANWPYPFDGGFVEEPHEGEIHMAAFRLPAGLQGNNIRLGTVTFRCKSEGTSQLMLLDRDRDWFVLFSETGDPVVVLDGHIGDGVLLTTLRRAAPGDVNGDGEVDLADAILVLRLMTKMHRGPVHAKADVNGDGRIGLPEATYILQKISK